MQAHAEADSVENGISVIKLVGRYSENHRDTKYRSDNCDYEPMKDNKRRKTIGKDDGWIKIIGRRFIWC
ncbi:hypothetical protein P8452_18837 [Trifolium repens]|nr:hypothetical protein P8452_18837 [Trifolium repens]